MVACRGVDDQALRLVDDDQGLILINDMQWNGLGSHLRDGFEDGGQHDFFAAEKFSLGFCGVSVHAHGAGPNPVLNPISGILRKKLA